MGFNTSILHHRTFGDEHTGATLTPIYQSSAFYQPSAEQHEKLFQNKVNDKKTELIKEIQLPDGRIRGVFKRVLTK